MAAPASERIDDEVEEGECSDSSDELGSISSQQIQQSSHAYSDKRTELLQRHRTQIPQIVINSDESSEESDEDYPQHLKRRKHPSHFQGRNNTSFVNPLLQSNASSLFSATSAKKRNNIWSSVISEQVLSHDVKTIGVNNSSDHMLERDVESYDFTKAKEDERPALEVDTKDNYKDDIFGGVVDLEREVKKHENRKRKRPAKERIGKRSFDKNKLRKLGVTEEDEVTQVVKAISDGLSEPKVDLIRRIVDNIGKAQAIQFYYMTEDVEEAGGMMIKSGMRRRTPGGVYIELLKTDSSIPEDVINNIFEDEEQEFQRRQKEQRKMKKASRKKWKKKKQQKTMDLDRPVESPSQLEDQEVLRVMGGAQDLDAADFPERPATPEPKDDSSDGQGQDDEDDDEEEEEEDEDISVAIAKAKAAILKKQRELAKKSSPQESDMNEDVDKKDIAEEQTLLDKEVCVDGDSCGAMAIG